MLDLTADLLVELGGWPALREARSLVERGKVTDARRENSIIRAHVHGADKIHEPCITLADRISQVEIRCTCAESRKSGRVCAHALAAGWAVLHPPAAAKATAQARPKTGPTRWPLDEAPAGTLAVQITVLLPLHLREALAQNSLRVILEARVGNSPALLPWDAAARNFSNGFAVSDEDARLLDALEKFTGSVAGINAIPRPKISEFLRSLSGHLRVWVGKKERLEIRAALERPLVLLQRLADGSLEWQIENATALKSVADLPWPGWHLDGSILAEDPGLSENLAAIPHIIPRDEIPNFLSRYWPRLERTCDLRFAPGFEEFAYETGRPVLEAHLDGALSGLTLNLIARYGEKSFSLGARGDPSPANSFIADPEHSSRFWLRDDRAEKAALADAESAGFQPARGGAALYSLTHENKVARFLANTLPRWRANWQVVLGPRLESTLRQIDVATPEFSLRAGSGEDWLSLDLQLSVAGKPVLLDTAEIQRWLQTGQSHTRTADQRVLLVPTEAWGEMREVLADCAVEQEPGRMRVARVHAAFLTGALTAQGFRAAGEMGSIPPAARVRDRLDPELWRQLRPYQIAGIEWLAGLAGQNFSGLLADEMGLGKTIQALVFCAWLRAESPSHGPALVVCPTSLVANWLREAARFVPHLRALDLTGQARAEKLAQIARSISFRLAPGRP